jgi:hypothetical protein
MKYALRCTVLYFEQHFINMISSKAACNFNKYDETFQPSFGRFSWNSRLLCKSTKNFHTKFNKHFIQGSVTDTTHKASFCFVMGCSFCTQTMLINASTLFSYHLATGASESLTKPTSLQLTYKSCIEDMNKTWKILVQVCMSHWMWPCVIRWKSVNMISLTQHG